VDEYSEITTILRDIERKFKANNIFISGSAVEYGCFSHDFAIELMHNLSKELIKKDYRIISG
jgi:hypothetical protein